MNDALSTVARRRALGYRLLGPVFDYVLHLRPAEWPIAAAHMTVCVLVAVEAAGGPIPVAAGVLGVMLWVVCLNGGTLAINSAFDRDEGDVAYLRMPPPPPRHLFAFGLLLMLAGLALAFLLPSGYRVAYGICVALSLAYSVPPVRLKAVAGADWVINIAGYGLLTGYAGWSATGATLNPWGAVVLVAFGPLFGALYPLTQLYQAGEDLVRGDRPLASVLGIRGSVWVALLGVCLAFLLLANALILRTWSAEMSWERWLALGGAALAWLAVLLPWLVRAPALPPASHQRRMYLALGAWALTDLAVLIAFAR